MINKFLAAITLLSFAFTGYANADECPEDLTMDSTTGHCIASGNDCGENCTWKFDTETKTLKFEGTGSMSLPDGLYSGNYSKAFNKYKGNKIEIGEGFTELGRYFFYGRIDSKNNVSVSLPSTMQIVDEVALEGAHKVEVLSDKINFAYQSMSNVNELTIIGSNDVTFNGYALGWPQYRDGVEQQIKINCKGDLSICQQRTSQMLELLTASGKVTANVDYYKGYDEKGNIIEEWGPNGKIIYQNKYDGAGNVVGIYKNGQLIYGKEIYTPAEAAAATKPTGNTVSITW